MSKQDNLHLEEESEGVIENLSMLPMAFPSAIITMILFLITFPFHFFSPGIHLLIFLPSLVSYFVSYLLSFFILFLVLGFYYRSKALHMQTFQNVEIFGINIQLLTARTGAKYIDWVGIVISVLLFIMSLLFPSIIFLSPFFFIATLAFTSAVITGSSKKWKLESR